MILIPTFTDVHHSDVALNVSDSQCYIGYLPILSPCKNGIFIIVDDIVTAQQLLKGWFTQTAKQIVKLIFSHLTLLLYSLQYTRGELKLFKAVPVDFSRATDRLILERRVAIEFFSCHFLML